MSEVLQHPLGPFPWSLANCDGTIITTNKAALARELEKKVASAESTVMPSATMIDGMSLIHKVQGENHTFAELSSSVLAVVLLFRNESDRLDVVFDVYMPLSIKSSEKEQRGPTQVFCSHKYYQVTG